MLCRALLAASALSCTFLLALANTQGTELVQLKDLVCVLWLSGLQKEDLDVNLLKKLHRHNVNIDDIMNNETMQHECAPKPESTIRTKSPVVKMKITATLSTTLDPAKSVNATRDKYIDTIVKLMTTAHSTNNNLTEVRKLDKTRRSPKTKNIQTNLLKPKNGKPNIQLESDSRREIQTDSKRDVETNSKREVEIESKEADLKLQQNILNFWEKMSKTEMPNNVDEVLATLPIVPTKDIFRQRLLSRRVPKLITPRPYFTTSTPLQSNDIDRLIARFISKNLGQVSSTTTTTTQRNTPDDFGEALLPFYRDLIRRYNGRQPAGDDVNGQVQANMYRENPNRNYMNYKEITEEPERFERINVHDTVLRSFDNILQNNGRINPFKRNMFPKLPYTGDILSKQQEMIDNMETLYDESNNRRSARINAAVNNDQNHNIPNNTLQQIAESVKAIVLKDIAHLIMSTTPPSTQPQLSTLPLLTTMRTSTYSQDPITTPKPDANHVMEKILEIYQRIKAISDNTDISLDAKYKQLSLSQEHSGASKQNLPPHSISNTNVIHRTSNVQNVLMNPRSFQDLTQQEIRKMPSIIQTNSGEIAPLVMPMANPLKIINQILVVTTETAVKKSDINEKVRSRFETFMEDLNKNKIHAVAHQKNDHKYNVPKHERYSHFGYSDLNHSHKDHIDVPSKYDLLSSELYDQAHRYRELYRGGANTRNRNRNGMEREHINYSEHVLGHTDFEKIPEHRHGEKFHEQLEKGDERWGVNRQGYITNERDRGHGRQVSPRHQQPLSDRKPPYDDTHFRNFLKTQEKVNDMLEKILGRKAKIDDYSVETT